MSIYATCETCGEFAHSRTHKCPPIWLVWCPEDGETIDDSRKVRATDAGEAVEKWAELDDEESAAYRIVGGQEARVCVVPADDKARAPQRFAVSGEAVPQYYASEVEG